MIMGPGLRKLALTAHVIFSVGWLGAVIAYLILAIAAITTPETGTIRAAWTAMELTGWFAIVPLAIASLVTGLVMSLGTKWGLFSHYWVLIKLFLTIFATVILLLHMPTVSYLARIAETADSAALSRLPGEILHPAAGLLVLLVTTILGLYKPRGLTRYGWRKLRGQ